MNLSLVFIYKFYKKEVLIQPGEPREQHLGEIRPETLKLKLNIRNHSNFSVNLQIVFIYFYFVKKIQPPGEPREHRLGEVLQGRSKFKFNIILSYLLVLFFGVQVSKIQTI